VADPNRPGALLQSGRPAGGRSSGFTTMKRPFVVSHTRPLSVDLHPGAVRQPPDGSSLAWQGGSRENSLGRVLTPKAAKWSKGTLAPVQHGCSGEAVRKPGLRS